MKIYNRDIKTGRIAKGHTALSKEERTKKFWMFVEMIPFNECWEWVGTIDEKGYGRFHVGLHKYQKAHRYSLGLVEDLKPGLVVDHKCRNRSCVNPMHLRQVTSTINTLENSRGIAALNAMKTHCNRGHEFTSENTGDQVSGRFCKTCVGERYKWKRLKFDSSQSKNCSTI